MCPFEDMSQGNRHHIPYMPNASSDSNSHTACIACTLQRRPSLVIVELSVRTRFRGAK